MHISDWVPPKTLEKDEPRTRDASEDASVSRPLIAMAFVAFTAVATMFACDHASNRFACAAHATAQRC